MKSTAHIKGHPLHPILVVFPIAFFTGTLVFDLLGIWSDSKYHETAVYLTIAGLIGAVLAAVPGIIDFIYTVPPKSTGKKRAAKHGLLNTTVLLLFGSALYYRLQSDDADPYIIIGLELVAESLLFIAGWMGGTLVYRNQIGVDPRYAGAGKWKEEYLKEIDGQVTIESIDSLKTDQMRLIHVRDKRIVVAKTETGYVAFSDHCTHRGASLAGGMMICGTVQCPWHGSQFDVTSGNVKAGPAKENIKIYKSQYSGGRLVVYVNGSNV
jgi:uncharacterized membrane protein/nitrite reductase/ring-hydroxylating ferredoxin subunit